MLDKNAPYQCEFFTEPKNALSDIPVFAGTPKTYKMAYAMGGHTIELESYYGQGIIVYYMPTGRQHAWDWEHRNDAWEWAKQRKAHIGGIMANGNYYSNR